MHAAPPPTLPRPKDPLAMGDRSWFPMLASRIFLNHGAVSPPSKYVANAVQTVLDDYMAHGLGALPRWLSQRARLKEKLARLINAEAKDIGLVSCTTQGIIDISWSIPWRKGDRVVSFVGEFPANVTPWQQAAKCFDLEMVTLPLDGFSGDAAIGLEALEAELRKGVRVVACSAVQFQTGLAMPLAEMGALCHRYGAELFVDAIQACGILPIDVSAQHIDYISCGSHKWLMGVEGCGFVYVSPKAVPHLVPRMAGWLSHENGLDFLFGGSGLLRRDRPVRKSADQFEVGAQNALGFAGLEAGLDPILELGVGNIHAHANQYLDQLEPLVREQGFISVRDPHPDRRAGILSVRVPAGTNLAQINHHLSAQGVATSTPDGLLRFAPSWPNALDEVPMVIAALNAAI